MPTDAHDAIIDRAVQDARGGTPGVLAIHGPPGVGKTTLLARCVERAAPLRTVTVSVAEPDVAAQPYALLTELGVTQDLPNQSIQSAARHLTEWIDRHTVSGPLLIAIDDLQWADEQSLSVLRLVIRRLEATAVLVAVSLRTGPGGIADLVNGWVRSHTDLHTVQLSGLSLEQAAVLVGQSRPEVAYPTIVELWRYTDGNPLFLTSLLGELGPVELEDLSGAWPAPRAFAASVGRRLTRLSPDARALVEAVSVLSAGASGLPDVVAVSGCADPHEALQELVDADLIQVALPGLLTVRPAHALIRAAVLEAIPLTRRRALHQAAASVVQGSDRVDHRLAATIGPDDELADELATLAEQHHNAGAFPQAARYYRAAARVSAPARRGHPELESLWNATLAGSRRALSVPVPEHVGELAAAALCHFLAGDVAAALSLLESLSGDRLAASGRATRQRVAVLRAYLRLLTGQATERVEEQLAVADGTGEHDPALEGLESPTRGFVAARRAGGDAELVSQFATLPANPAAVEEGALGLLAWRGVYELYALQVRRAVTDFEALVTRSGRRRDVSVLRDELALAQWLAGDWSMARIAVGLPTTERVRWAPDIAPALVDAGRGRFAAADLHLAQAIDTSRKAPWPEGRLMLLVARVVRAHSAGLPHSELAALIADHRDLGGLLKVTGPSDGLLLLHAGQLALWAGWLEVADRCIATMAAATLPAPSTSALLGWLRALRAEQAGDVAGARRLLARAADDESNELPLYRAHILADAARLSTDADQAATARARALEAYRRLGATAYVERLEAISAEDARRHDATYLPGLTEREHAVLALLIKGLSYAQIADRLFVTRSAVAFHLSNLYAKFAVRSRHDLTAHVLLHPEVLTR